MSDLGKVKISEDQYRADLELLDRYQKYSSEIIRLSLLGIAGLAFFIVQIVSGEHVPEQSKDWVAGMLIGTSSVLFMFATAAALSHRYHSTDGLYFHFKSLRLTNSDPPQTEKATEVAEVRNSIYRKAGIWLTSAVGLFGAGGFFFVLGFGRLIYVWAFN